MTEMLAAFASITGVLWEKMNERGVFSGKDYALFFLKFYWCFLAIFVSFSFPSSSNLFFYFSLHLKVSYSASNFIIFIKT